MDNHLRASQQAILEYKGGKMGISAVPGSGKTWTLSRLATNLVMKANLEEEQEVLIVTFSNTAVENFSTRISNFLKEHGVLPGLGYRVRTLHGLAVDILRMRPEVAGLSEDFSIVDKEQTDVILNAIVSRWISAHQSDLDELLTNGKYHDSDKSKVVAIFREAANSFIRTAKDFDKDPQELERLSHKDSSRDILLEFNLEAYALFQAELNYLGGIDFNDMLRLAYQTLLTDPTLVSQLSYKWPYVLEDEAQDSSEIQQEILKLLTSETENWVRVGDTNQSINESFTTSSPELLKTFLSDPSVRSMNLPESGRSAPAIIDLANTLNHWVQKQHPNLFARDSLTDPLIEPTKPDDPQQNPIDVDANVVIDDRPFSSDEEVTGIARVATRWSKANPEKTVAILAYTNNHINKFVQPIIDDGGTPVDLLLKVPKTSRITAGILSYVLNHLSNVANPIILGRAFKAFFRDDFIDKSKKQTITGLQTRIEGLSSPEQYLYPLSSQSWEEAFGEHQFSEEEIGRLSKFRNTVKRWHEAATLPLDQMIVTISQEFSLELDEIALAYQIATRVKRMLEVSPNLSLDDTIKELKDMYNNDGSFGIKSDEEGSFNPEAHKGKIVLSTIHKAKGLEWDKVFITSTSTYDFPSGADSDRYIAESTWLKGNRNFQAESIELVKFLVDQTGKPKQTSEVTTYTSRICTIRERLRLLYVGLTRAKQELYISWNTGRHAEKQALPIKYLSNYLKEKNE